MSNRLGFVFLLIPGLGILAFVAWLGLLPDVSGAVRIGGGALVLLAFVWVGRRRARGPERSIARPRVIGARYVEGLGELTVEASNSKAVSDLGLPLTAKITTVRRNELYQVEIPLSRKSHLEGIARNIGYRGEVGE